MWSFSNHLIFLLRSPRYWFAVATAGFIGLRHDASCRYTFNEHWFPLENQTRKTRFVPEATHICIYFVFQHFHQILTLTTSSRKEFNHTQSEKMIQEWSNVEPLILALQVHFLKPPQLWVSVQSVNSLRCRLLSKKNCLWKFEHWSSLGRENKHPDNPHLLQDTRGFPALPTQHTTIKCHRFTALFWADRLENGRGLRLPMKRMWVLLTQTRSELLMSCLFWNGCSFDRSERDILSRYLHVSPGTLMH